MGEVSLQREGAVAVVTISAPEVRNALSGDMGEALVRLCEEIDADPTIGAAVVQGAGHTFCSGADTRGWSSNLDPASEESYGRTSAIYRAFTRVGQLAVPTIAAVRGAAVGAGLNLALATDLRVVSGNCRLIGGFQKAGIHPGGGFFTLMARSAGREAAAALGLFRAELSGTEATRLGMAWKAVADEEVETAALALAAEAAQEPELARMSVAIFRSEVGPPGVSWAAAVEMERGVQMWSQRRRQVRVAEED